MGRALEIGLTWAVNQSEICPSYAKTTDQGNGRIETRECWVSPNLEIFDQRCASRDLKAVVRVRGTREIDDRVSVEDRLFITSLPSDAARVMRAVRLHWGIERSAC